MSTDPAKPCSGATLAATVRSLAKQAHLLLNDPTTQDHELRDLARRIGKLQDHVASWPPSDLTLWLESLRGRVEASIPRGLCATYC
jgi:hypothetical protein